MPEYQVLCQQKKKIAKDRHNLELRFLLAITIVGDRTQKKLYKMTPICIHFAVAKQLAYKKRASLILAENKLMYKLSFKQ